MDELYLALVITSISMIVVLVLVFFDIQIKKILAAQLYSRTFTVMALVTATGILCSITLGFTSRYTNVQAPVFTSILNKP